MAPDRRRAIPLFWSIISRLYPQGRLAELLRCIPLLDHLLNTIYGSQDEILSCEVLYHLQSHLYAVERLYVDFKSRRSFIVNQPLAMDIQTSPKSDSTLRPL